MIEMDALAGKVFSLLKGNGLQIKIYNDAGAETTDPNVGRRFFVANPNIMVTIDEDNNSIEFSKGADVDEQVAILQRNIKKLASEFMMNSNIKVFGKQIQPRDYAYQAKIKGAAMMENEMNPHSHHLVGEIMKTVKKWGGKISEADLCSNTGMHDLDQARKVLNKLVTDGKLAATPGKNGHIQYSIAMDEAVYEGMYDEEGPDRIEQKISNALSGKAGIEFNNLLNTVSPYSHDHEAITQALNVMKSMGKIKTVGQGKNGPVIALSSINESFSKMFGSLKTSQQTLENVRILVRHKTPVDENVRGSRSRHISAIFLESNGERFRFPHNYLPGARAMAQHMAHGGIMGDKVGSYITENVGNLLKLQSFNRYVTTNKLINEDSSGIIETVKENIETIRTELKKLTGVKTYETVKARVETFEREALAEDDTSGLKELFTIRRFDEKFEEVLPIVKQLVQEKDTFHKRIEEAASNAVSIRREAINTTPMFEFASENARLGFKINELALRILENDELAGFINKIGTKLCKEGQINDFEKAVFTQVLENVKIEEKVTIQKEIKESIDLVSYYDRYDYIFLQKPLNEAKFEVTHHLKPNGAQTYRIEAETADEAVAKSKKIHIPSRGFETKRITVKAVK